MAFSSLGDFRGHHAILAHLNRTERPLANSMLNRSTAPCVQARYDCRGGHSCALRWSAFRATRRVLGHAFGTQPAASKDGRIIPLSQMRLRPLYVFVHHWVRKSPRSASANSPVQNRRRASRPRGKEKMETKRTQSVSATPPPYKRLSPALKETTRRSF